MPMYKVPHIRVTTRFASVQNSGHAYSHAFGDVWYLDQAMIARLAETGEGTWKMT